MEETYLLSVVFALVLSAGASAYALLAWRLFRTSPAGNAMGLLLVAMLGSVGYHTVSAVYGETLLTEVAEAGMNTVLLVLVLVVIRMDAKLRRLTERNSRHR